MMTKEYKEMENQKFVISEEDFFDFFRCTIENIENDYKKNGVKIQDIYKDNAKWTQTILDYIECGREICIRSSESKGCEKNPRGIKEKYKNYGLKTEREYYRIDLIAYDVDKVKCKEKLGLNWHVWNLQLAFEHENNSKDWTDEVTKLAHIKCGLRVVVGYSEDPSKNQEKLDFCSKMLDKLAYGKPNDDDRWLIILGICGQKSYSNLKDYYTGYEWDSEQKKFVPLS